MPDNKYRCAYCGSELKLSHTVDLMGKQILLHMIHPCKVCIYEAKYYGFEDFDNKPPLDKGE
jgi:hypothetical protein